MARKLVAQVKARDIAVGDKIISVRQVLKVAEIEKPKAKSEQNEIIFHLSFGFDGSTLLHQYDLDEEVVRVVEP